MTRHLDHRLAQLRTRIPAGCPACRHWPHVWILNPGDPEPPVQCDGCGRRFTGLIRVYLLDVAVADI